MFTESISEFVRSNRKREKITQPQLAINAGVGLRFVRELEAGKKTLRTDKVNQVLNYFNHQLGVVKIPEEKSV